MGKWQRHLFQPGIPLGKDGQRETGSTEPIALSRRAADEAWNRACEFHEDVNYAGSDSKTGLTPKEVLSFLSDGALT